MDVTIDQIHEIKELSIDINIKTIAKDSCNQIWVGADNGLYRFDGKTVKQFNFNFVKVVKRLRDERIAVLTDDGLFSISTLPYSCKIDTLILSSKKMTEEHLFYPKSLYEDKYGALWIGEDRDIMRYKNGQIKRFRFKKIDPSGFLHRSYDFAEDGFGQLWAIAYGGNLLRYDFEKETFIIVKTGLWNEVSSAIALGDDKIWLGTKNGIYEIQVNAKGELLSSTQIADIPKVSKIEITDKYVLVATWENGMYQVDFQGNVQKVNSLRYAQIFDFFIEKNAIWIANRENVLMLHPSPIELIIETQNRFIPSINLLKDNRLVVNTGRNVFLTTQSYKGLSQQLIFDTQQQFWVNDVTLVRDTLWMATSSGIYTLDLKFQQLKRIISTQRNNWNDKFYLDSKDVIWISGKTEMPVISIKNGKIKHWEKLKKCLTITENGKGVLFVAGDNGTIFRQQSEGFEQLNIEFTTAEKPTIHTIQFLADSLYLGTNQGLWVISENGLHTEKPRLIFKGDISSLVIDRHENLWFGYTKGLMLMKNGELHHFNRSNGLPSKYIVARGLTIDANDQIWINTSKGVAKANIENLTAEQTPKPHIFDLYIQNKKRTIKHSNLGVFKTNQSISLGVTALTFPTDNVQYKVDLYRNNELYNRQKSRGLTSFLGLKQGSYTLKIWAKQNSAQWSSPAIYTFSIQNPWYKTRWFYFLSLVIIFGLIVFFTKLYNRQLRYSNEKLEALVQERTENIEQQRNELIEHQRQIITQQKELIQKNTDLTETQKALTASEIQYLELKKNQMQLELDLKAKQLTTHTLHLVEKNQLLLKISKKLEALAKSKDHKETAQNIRKLSQQIKNSIKNDNHWESFRLYFEQVHADFYTKLKLTYPNLTTNDLKQCALVKLNLSLEDSATLLGVSSESVRISRYRIQKKMGLTSQANFYDFLMKL